MLAPDSIARARRGTAYAVPLSFVLPARIVACVHDVNGVLPRPNEVGVEDLGTANGRGKEYHDHAGIAYQALW